MTPLKTQTLVLPNLLRLLAVVVLVGVAVWYAAWQARHLIIGPEITLLNDPAVTQDQRVVNIKGVVNNVTALYLNGRPLVTDREGKFSVGVVLENGYTIISIEAKDRYGRITKLEREFVYRGSEAANTTELTLSN